MKMFLQTFVTSFNWLLYLIHRTPVSNSKPHHRIIQHQNSGKKFKKQKAWLLALQLLLSSFQEKWNINNQMKKEISISNKKLNLRVGGTLPIRLWAVTSYMKIASRVCSLISCLRACYSTSSRHQEDPVEKCPREFYQ